MRKREREINRLKKNDFKREFVGEKYMKAKFLERDKDKNTY